MNQYKKLLICTIVNVILTLFVILIVFIFADGGLYWRIGPQKDLVLISIIIDTWYKYIFSIILVSIIRIAEVITSEIGGPILGFTIYNPDKKIVKEFTKNQLQFFANTKFILDGFRGALMIMVSIAQVDIAIISMLSSEIVSCFTIRYLLNEKTFLLRNNSREENIDLIINE